MLAFQTTTPAGPFAALQSETPVPVGRQVLLRTVATGVCHSDVHLHDTHFDLGQGKTLPAGRPGMTLGHEIVGTVAAVGPAVSGIAAGDACVAYPWIGCGHCVLCAAGDEQLCAAGAVLGIDEPGGFADHVLVPDTRYLFPIGDLAPGFACTLACSGLTAFSALGKIGALAADDALVIVGAGGVGLYAVQMAERLTGVRPIVVDIRAEKLDAAITAGAAEVVDARDPDAAARLRRLTQGGAAASIDFVGSEATSQLAQRALRKRGKLVIVGLFGGTFSMPLPMIPLLAQRIEGSYVGRLDQMAVLVSLARSGRISSIPIHTRAASAETIELALDELRAGRVTGRTVLTF